MSLMPNTLNILQWSKQKIICLWECIGLWNLIKFGLQATTRLHESVIVISR